MVVVADSFKNKANEAGAYDKLVLNTRREIAREYFQLLACCHECLVQPNKKYDAATQPVKHY
jgi:hypothetical protein